MSNSIKKAVIIDIGSCYTKIGFSGEDNPRFVFPTVVGYVKDNLSSFFDKPDLQTGYIGYDALQLRPILNIVYPVVFGVIKGWKEFELIIAYCYQLLKVKPSDHPVILTEPPLNPESMRQKIAKIFFNEFGVPNVHIMDTATLALYESGKTIGLVVDIGHKTNVIPIFEGFFISHAITKRENDESLAETIFHCYETCDLFPFALEKEWKGYSLAIIVTGEVSLIKGLKERLENELNKLFTENVILSIISSPEFGAWRGASILASTNTNLEIFRIG